MIIQIQIKFFLLLFSYVDVLSITNLFLNLFLINYATKICIKTIYTSLQKLETLLKILEEIYLLKQKLYYQLDAILLEVFSYYNKKYCCLFCFFEIYTIMVSENATLKIFR